MRMKTEVNILGVALLLSARLVVNTAAAEENPFRAEDYAAFRKELRAFYPDECHGVCKDPRQTNSVARIGRELDAWAAAHPGFDALDIRRESYLLMRKHFVPILFRESPFYFETGVNGGWCMSPKSVPSRHVNRICSRFYRKQNLIPQSAFDLLNARTRLSRNAYSSSTAPEPSVEPSSTQMISMSRSVCPTSESMHCRK